MASRPAALAIAITRPGSSPRRRSGPMPTAVTRNPQTIASVVSSMWKAAASRVCPLTCISHGTAHSPWSATKPPRPVAVIGA